MITLDYSRGSFRIEVREEFLIRGQEIGRIDLKKCLTPAHTYPYREEVERVLQDHLRVEDEGLI